MSEMRFVTLGQAAKALGRSKSALLRDRKAVPPRIQTVLMDDGTNLYGVPSHLLPPEPTESPVPVEDELPDTEPGRPPPELVEASRELSTKTAPPSPPTPRVRKAISIYDAHVPFHDRATWRACMEVIKDEQPDEIILVGDFLDVSSMSSHAPGGWEIGTLSEEVEAGKMAIEELRRFAGEDCRIIYMEGNHESRPRRTANQRLSQVADLLDIDKLLGLREQGIRWVSEGRALKRGHLRYVHGYWTNEQHAKKHLVKLLWPGVIYGHTHRPQMYSMADGDNNVRVAYGMPCMCELTAEWMRGQPTGWVNGFGVTYVDEDTGNFNVYPVLCFDGRFMWAGKIYDGNELRVGDLSLG